MADIIDYGKLEEAVRRAMQNAMSRNSGSRGSSGSYSNPRGGSNYNYDMDASRLVDQVYYAKQLKNAYEEIGREVDKQRRAIERNSTLTTEQKKQQQDKLRLLRAQLEVEAQQNLYEIQRNQLLKLGINEWRDLAKQQKESAKARIEDNEALLKITRDTAKRRALEAEIRKDRAIVANQSKQEEKLNRAIVNGQRDSASIAERIASAKERAKKYNEEELKNRRQLQQEQNIINQMIKEGLLTEEEGRKRRQKAQEDFDEQHSTNLANARFRNENDARVATAIGTLTSVVSSIGKTLTNRVEEAAKIQAQYMGKVDARLQSEEEQIGFYEGIVKDAQSTISLSRFVTQEKFLQNVQAMVDKGVAYNLEQRALLATLSDKMVTTFDALDDTLASVIRVQQADMTMSQMGSEALLTQFLNSQFEDTSFLNGAYDAVFSALTDSIATMDRNAATSFTYAVEKWLGSLYSVGLSQQTVGTIAQGINALATGNVAYLNGNQPMSVLLNTAAANAGYSYSDLLVNGLSSTNVNDLMLAIVNYLADISDNTAENKVLQSQWSDILGVSLTDLRAARNLTANDLSTIYQSQTTYDRSVQETQNQLHLVEARTSTAEGIDNAIENLWFDWGTRIASDAGNYLMWELSDAIKTGVQDLGIQDVDLFGMSLGDVAGILGTVMSMESGLSALGGIIGQDVLGLPSVDDITNLFTGGGSFLNRIKTTLGFLTNNPLESFVNALGAGSLQGFDWDEYTMRGPISLSEVGVRGTGSIWNSDDIFSGRSGSFAVDDIGYVTNGVSSSSYYTSSSASTSSSSASTSINNLVTQGNNLADAATVVTGVTQQITDSAASIYEELFVNKKAVRVSISGVESTALDDLIVSNWVASQISGPVNEGVQQIKSSIETITGGSSFFDIMRAVRGA